MLNKAGRFTIVAQMRKDPQGVKNRNRMVKNERKPLVTAIFFMLYLMIHELYLLMEFLIFIFYFMGFESRSSYLLARRAEFPETTGQDFTNSLVRLSNFLTFSTFSLIVFGSIHDMKLLILTARSYNSI